MYGNKGEVPEDPDFTIPLGVADVKREGTDVTIVAQIVDGSHRTQGGRDIAGTRRLM